MRAVLAAALLAAAAAPALAGTNAGALPANPTKPFTETAVATFDYPWAIAFLPDGHMLVTEKPGHLWLVDPTNGQKREVAGVPAVAYEGQGGLLDVAVSPHYDQDHAIYLTYAEPGEGGSGLALMRAELLGNAQTLELAHPQVIWRDPAKGQGGQFGGIVTFDPEGQHLFLTVGERQRFTPAQDMNSPLGKILRLTLDGKPAPGNPWAGKTGATTLTIIDPPKDTVAAQTAKGRQVTIPAPNLVPSEIWTLGHRNPYGLLFRGNELWEEELGPRGGDELNLIQPGKNYGWPIVSNGKNYDGVPIPDQASHPQFAAPVVYWVPVISPSGFTLYHGKLFSGWDGDGFIGGLSSQSLVRIVFDGHGGARQADRWDMGHRIRDVATGPDGALWVIEDEENGRLLKLTPKG